MADVYVPQRGDHYHLYENCRRIEYGRSNDGPTGWDTYPACLMPLHAAQRAGRNLCPTCRETAGGDVIPDDVRPRFETA